MHDKASQTYQQSTGYYCIKREKTIPLHLLQLCQFGVNNGGRRLNVFKQD
jgi:hypothetical protein